MNAVSTEQVIARRPAPDERHGYLGGSDWESLLGEILPKDERAYGCPRRLFYTKTDFPPDYPEDVTGPMRRGNRLEDVAVAMYEEATGRRTMRRERFRATDVPDWWGGHIDRAIVAADGEGPGILEVKTVGERVWWGLVHGGIPQRWLAQVHHYLGLSGYAWGALFVYWADGDLHALVEVKRDEPLLKIMRDVGTDFWQRVARNEPPDRLEPKDRRCQGCPFRHSCQGVAMLEAAGEETGEIERVDDADLLRLVRDEREANEVAIEADAVLEVCREKIRQAIWHKNAIEVPGYRLYFRAVKTQRVDTTRLRKEEPEIAAKFSREVITRPLRVFPV
jgi:predicted phage-related endonuclease